MKASVGDHLMVKGAHVGNANREGKVLEVHGEGGAPPYLVRWSDGHTAVVYPGADAVVTPPVSNSSSQPSPS